MLGNVFESYAGVKFEFEFVFFLKTFIKLGRLVELILSEKALRAV